MSVNTELQALLTKMGGTPLESDSNSDLIKKISNAYEGGGGCNCLIINVDENGVLDKTWKEIYDAKIAVIVAHEPNSEADARIFVNGAVHTDASQGYLVYASNATSIVYVALTENDYPSQVTTDSNSGNAGGGAQPT